jgi:hypothetical protein
LLAALFAKAGADGVHAVLNQLDSSVLIAMKENNILAINWTSADGKDSKSLSINFDNVPLQVLTDLSNQVEAEMEAFVGKNKLKLIGHAMDAYGKVDEFSSYCDAVTSAKTPEQAFENMGTAMFRAHVPGADIVEGAVMGDTSAVAWGCVNLAGMYFPPLGMGLALQGMGKAALEKGYQWWWTSSLEHFVDGLYENAVFTPEKTEQIDGKVVVDRKWILESVKYNKNVIDRKKLLADMEASWMSYWDDETLRKNLAETDPFLAIYEECEKHPNASAKLSGRFKESYEKRWKDVRKEFFTHMIERLEARKRADMAGALGQVDKMVEELKELTSALQVQREVFTISLGKSLTGEIQARANETYDWLVNMKRTTLDQPLTQDENQRLTERIAAALDQYRKVTAARKSVMSILSGLFDRAGPSVSMEPLDGRELLAGLPMLTGDGALDGAFAIQLARQAPAEQRNIEEVMLRSKLDALAGTKLNTPLDHQYLAELYYLHMFVVAYRARVSGEAASGELWSMLDLAWYGPELSPDRGPVIERLNSLLDTARAAYTAKLKEYRDALTAALPVSITCDPGSARDPASKTIRLGPKDEVTLRMKTLPDAEAKNPVLTWTVNGQPIVGVRVLVLDANLIRKLKDPDAATLVVVGEVVLDSGRSGEATEIVRRIFPDEDKAKEQDDTPTPDTEVADSAVKNPKSPAAGKTNKEDDGGLPAKPDGGGPTGLFDRFLNFFSTLQPVPPAPEVGNQTVSEKPGTMTKNLGKQPVKVPAKPAVSPAKRNEVPLPPPATPPAVKKAPEVIAPRPGMLPALKIPAEVVYGTSLVINEGEASTLWPSMVNRAEERDTTLTPEQNAAIFQAGQPSGTTVKPSAPSGKASPISAEEKLYQEQLAAYDAAWAVWQKEEDRRKEARMAAAKKELAAVVDAWQKEEDLKRKKNGVPVVTALEKEAHLKSLSNSHGNACPFHEEIGFYCRKYCEEHLSDPPNESPKLQKPSPPSTPKPEPDGRRYFFKSTPDLRFEPVEATSATTKVTFTRLGRVSIWMEIVDKDGKRVGETTPAMVNVVPPKFALVLEPSSSVKVGQEVVAMIETTPPIPADLLDYRWLEPPTANRLEKTPNASQIVFKATAKPVTLQALARVPHYGDALGEVRQECRATACTVVVTPVRRGPIPKEWSTEARGLVDVSRTFLIDEQFSLKAQLDGEGVPSAVRWRWTVNGGTTLSNPSVSEPTVSRHERGEVSASVEALDSLGNLLGQAEISVRVVSEDEFLKPLAVTIKLDAPSVEVGKKAVARAEVTGGRQPYVLEWSPAGSGMQLELLPKEEGSQNIAVTVRDKRKKEARASAALKVEALPLEASVKPDRPRALCGENVSLAASASGGTKPYQFRWTAPAKGQGEQGSLTSLKAGSIEAGVEVTDAKGRTAQAKATVSFDPLSLTITGLQPKEKPGATRTAKAGENLPQGITVKFQTSPSLPIKASGRSAEIRFDKSGQYEVQAAAYATVEGVEQEVAKAPPVKVEVEEEPLQLVLEPTEISVGEEASARLVNPSGQPPKDVRADWTFAAGAGETVLGTSAKLRPDAPGSFAVSVQWKDATSGKVSGQANVTLNVKPLNLEIVVDPVGGGEFVLRISPGVKIPSGVVVNWAAAGADFVGPKHGSIIRVRLSSGAMKSSVTATASNARSIEVGRAAASFEASQKADPPQLAQKHIEKGHQEEQAGRLESACTEYEQALKLAPDPQVSSRLDALRQKLALARQEAERAAKTKELLGAGFRKESAGDIEGALADYEAAQKLTADARIDAHMRELRDKIAQAKTKQAPAAQTGTGSQDKTDKAQGLLNEAFKKESAGDLSGAHESYVKALALKFDKRVWERVDALEKRIENSEKQAEKARTAKPASAPASPADAPEAKKPAAANSLIAQKKAEVLRLSKEAMAIGNSMMSGNVNLATAQSNSQRIQQIQGQIQRLTAEIKNLEAGR